MVIPGNSEVPCHQDTGMIHHGSKKPSEACALGRTYHCTGSWKDLYSQMLRIGATVGGALSRQPGGSMTWYVGRRRRWYHELKQLHDKIQIQLSDDIFADFFMDNSGLDKKERLMIRKL